MVRVDRKSIDVPAPTVPSGNHHPDHLFVGLGYEQRGRTAREKSFDVLAAIRGTGMPAAGKRPKAQNRVDIVTGAASNRDFAPCQVMSLRRSTYARSN